MHKVSGYIGQKAAHPFDALYISPLLHMRTRQTTDSNGVDYFNGARGHEFVEQRFLVDTGDTAENSTPGYYPWWNPFFSQMVQIKVAPVEELGFRLQAMGLDAARTSRR